jgi:hypothetical protein
MTTDALLRSFMELAERPGSITKNSDALPSLGCTHEPLRLSPSLTVASARAAGLWVLIAVVSLALLGTWATFRMMGSAKAAAD